MAQEFLSTFENELRSVSLKPSEVNGNFQISINDEKIFDRKEYGGFPEIKELKQIIRDRVAPGKDLGHADTPVHHQ
jgi:selenoprotein W-related protein